MEFPTLAIRRVAHIGMLERADKQRSSFSWEGHGLSVSVHPEEWEMIARLGGRPWWLLENSNGRFLDFWALTDAQREEISRWGVSGGYAEQRIMWAAGYYDDELESRMVSYHVTRELADEEASEQGDVEEVLVLHPTERLSARLGMRSPSDCLDHLTVCFVEDECPTLDGVWWTDTYRPYALSAPRGVILPARLDDWAVEPLDRSCAVELLDPAAV